jgi:dTDP-4-amino-4,6-dideoxygalactose transaminase
MVPGNKIKDRGFWLFPIIVPNKILFNSFLNQKGINAYRGATQLCYVKPMPGYKECEYSAWFMDNVIYLPFHASVPDKDFKNILERTIDAYA